MNKSNNIKVLTNSSMGLNPYCSGRWSRTMLIMHEQGDKKS